MSEPSKSPHGRVSVRGILRLTYNAPTEFRDEPLTEFLWPEVPVLCLTEKMETARRLALCWGTHCVQTPDVHSFSEMVEKACRIAREQGIADKGQRLVVTAGVPFGTPGSTNVLRIAWVED